MLCFLDSWTRNSRIDVDVEAQVDAFLFDNVTSISCIFLDVPNKFTRAQTFYDIGLIFMIIKLFKQRI